MPTIRFSDNGKEYSCPDKLKISDLFDKISDTNKDGSNKNVITNSAEFGLIPQRSFFDKDIAVEENTNKYTIIKKGDFVYNPRKSTTAPYGPFNCYNYDNPGIVSPLYSCLRPKNHDYTEYLLYYFSSPAWYSYIYYNGNQGGARHDRVGMTDKLLKGLPVYLPCKDEREKIVAFLQLFDKKVEIQERKLHSITERKRGILSQIFSRELRFTGEDSYSEWKNSKLNEILTERKDKASGKEEVFSVSVSKGLVNQVEHLGRSYAADDTSKYNLVCPGDVIYTKSPTGEFKWGIVKQSTIEKDVVVSPLYGVFIPKNKHLGAVLDAYFSSSKRAHNYLITQIRKGAKNTINVSNDEFLDKELCLPTDEREQKKISDFVELLNKEIDIETKKLESYKRIKKSLLYQMFVE